MSDDLIPISNEMLAAGVEALREARSKDFRDVDLVRDVYEAMYGEAVKNYQGIRETEH
jgi:hypothetical protein